MIKAISFAVFGFHLPRTYAGSHLIEPVNPFKPFESEQEYIDAIKTNYPEEHHNQELMSFLGEKVLTEQQFQTLLEIEGFTRDAPYNILKLL